MVSKRSGGQEHDSRPTKRPKHDQGPKDTPVEEIQFARQLQHLLAFRQDGVQQLRHGIASFKAFLESLLYQKNEDDQPRQLSILREYLDGERPADVNDLERPFLSQLWQAWSFANQNNNDHLASSIGAVLALLLKTVSSLLDFRDHGIVLCRTILQHQHLRLLKRCLDAPKQKEFLISPCLRLLIEITSFDGGVLASDVYKRREQTFDIGTLRRNLGLVKTGIPEEELNRRPSIRTWTIRYILAHLKYLHEGAKIDLLKSRPLCTSLFQHLKYDPPDTIKELLNVVEQHILKDDGLPRSAKASVLVQQNLERVTEVATRSKEGHAAAENAFAWLKAVCSSTTYGILRTSGWYPPGTTDAEHTRQVGDIIDLGLDTIEFYDRGSRPDLRNTTLLSWIQTLRPHTNLHERKLVLACFISAPELVSAYFAEKNMQLEPKLSNTWIGYASFLFEVVRLPVPEFLGNDKERPQLPPQTKVMIESILPRPLTQKILTRCVNQNSELITFFAVRLLVLSLEKLNEIRLQLRKGAIESDINSALWREASEILSTRFVERCPKMKDVITAFRKTPDDNGHALQREALSKLLRLYYEVTPLEAQDEQFDVSTALAAALVKMQSRSETGEVEQIKALELEHLLLVARHSPGMRWFSKQGSLELSPILAVLQIHRNDLQSRPMRDLIIHVLSESNILSSVSACDALVVSLSNINDDCFRILSSYLEDWLLRATRKPVKYLDDLEIIASQCIRDGNNKEQVRLPSLLVAVLLEQASFVAAAAQPTKTCLFDWISDYINVLMHTDEKSAVLETIQKSITELRGWTTVNNLQDNVEDIDDQLRKVRLPEVSIEEATNKIEITDSVAAVYFSPPPVESTNHPELFKWTRKDLDMALEDGDVESLMICLSSQYLDIRAQAHSQLYKLADACQNSSVREKDAIYVLIGELIETYEHHYLPKSEPLHYLATTFAANALRVQMQPTHYMYPKINRYLNKGPEWRVHKLPTYWTENTFLALPEEDDAYWKETQWVLDWLVDGLRTAADLELLRRGGVLERVMSLYSSPGAEAHRRVKEKVLELLWRVTFIYGGSTTLTTRTGVLSWLEMSKRGDSALEVAMRKRILETCERARVEEWSGLKPDEL